MQCSWIQAYDAHENQKVRLPTERVGRVSWCPTLADGNDEAAILVWCDASALATCEPNKESATI
jgi:hypothetical protein